MTRGDGMHTNGTTEMKPARSAKVEPPSERIAIKPINFQQIAVEIRGTSPLMQARFSKKAEIMAKMASEDKPATKGRGATRPPRDYDKDFREAMHLSTEGWNGIPAPAFRNACIDACRGAGYQMTRAKMSIFILGDGFDRDDGMPLVKLIAGEAERTDLPVRNDNGSVDIRVRPMWREWGCVLRVRFDGDQFTASDAVNLIERAGHTVGVGEGRHFSKNSSGLGYGCFEVRRGS